MKWKFAEINIKKRNFYSHELGISQELATVFVNRDIDITTANKLVHHTYQIVQEPVPIKGMDIAVNFVLNCIKEKRPIHIFADYDCDGLTSGYIAESFFNNFEGITAKTYYPERIENYGLSKMYCRQLIEQYKEAPIKPLLITVDNGITKKSEVQMLREYDIQVLVTDHHLVDTNSLPEDCVILDPYMGKTGHNLCGAAVIWNLCRAIENAIQVGNGFTDCLLYAAAIGMLADVMPLDEYNIALTTLGLYIMNSDQALPNIKVFRRLFGNDGSIDSDTISWTLAPMLNACGRMGDVNLGANFFFETDEDTLISILNAIKELNESRKQIENQAVTDIQKNIVNDRDEVLCIIGDDYPVGIHGLIANKIMQKYNKPTFVLKSISDESIYIGSCRSNTVPLNILLKGEKEKGNIQSFGGHAFAGGISIAKDKLDILVNDLNKRIRKMKKDGSFEQYLVDPVLNIDDELSLQDICNQKRSELNTYAYDKKKFKAPVWAFCNLSIDKLKASRNNPDNICFTVSDGEHTLDIWGWNIRERYEELGKPDTIDIAGQLTSNFMRPKQTTLRILDIRKSET